MHYLCSYIKDCYVCQLTRKDKPPTRQLQTRIILNYRPLSRLSMDLKVMPKLHKGHKFILCILDEVTNYLILCMAVLMLFYLGLSRGIVSHIYLFLSAP